MDCFAGLAFVEWHCWSIRGWGYLKWYFFHFYGNRFHFVVSPFAVCICGRVAVIVGSQKTKRLYLCGWHSWAPRQLKILTNNANTNKKPNTYTYTHIYKSRNVHRYVLQNNMHQEETLTLVSAWTKLNNDNCEVKPGWHKQTHINVQIHCIKYKVHVLLAIMGCIRGVLGFVAWLNWD